MSARSRLYPPSKRWLRHRFEILFSKRDVYKRQITICTFLSLTNGFKLFDQNLALTGGQPYTILSDGSSIKTTEMLALNILNTFYGQNANSRGTAQAKAVLFFILVASIGLLQLRSNRKKEVQQ